jgi:hypothetical protein
MVKNCAPDLFLVRKLLKNRYMRREAAALSAFVRPGEKALSNRKQTAIYGYQIGH